MTAADRNHLKAEVDKRARKVQPAWDEVEEMVRDLLDWRDAAVFSPIDLREMRQANEALAAFVKDVA